VFFSTVVNIQVVATAVTILVGGPGTALSCLLAAPVLMVGARFSRRGLLVGAPLSGVLDPLSTAGG
jgi:hypothetical protein